MAGEWLPYDVGTPRKPEVLELVDRTGLENATVVGRLAALWGWASLNSSDGTVRISVRLLAKECGGDEDFWRAVEDVGWLVVDAENGTVAIPGWDRRFSKSAKSRALAQVRHEVDKAGGAARPSRGRVAPPRGAPRAPERGDRGDRNSSSSPGDAAQGDPEPAGPAGWETLRTAWAAGTGRPWKLPDPPDKASDRLAEEGWFQKALAAIRELPRCRYFRDPVTLPQLLSPGFVDKVLGGQFDNPREPGRGPRGPEDRRPAAEAASDWARGAAEQAARRQAYLEAKAGKAAPAEPGAGDDDLERTRSEMIRKLREGACT
jgi:hypothetical protein